MYTKEQLKRIISVFSSQNTQVEEKHLWCIKRKGRIINQGLKYTGNICFWKESKIKTLTDRQKQRACAPSTSSLQELLKANTSIFCLAHRSWKEHHSHPDK